MRGPQVRNHYGEVWNSQEYQRAWRTDSASRQLGLNMVNLLRGRCLWVPWNASQSLGAIGQCCEAEKVWGEADGCPTWTWVPVPNFSKSIFHYLSWGYLANHIFKNCVCWGFKGTVAYHNFSGDWKYMKLPLLFSNLDSLCSYSRLHCTLYTTKGKKKEENLVCLSTHSSFTSWTLSEAQSLERRGLKPVLGRWPSWASSACGRHS